MTRLRSELSDADLELLAELTGTVAPDLVRELSRRPWHANDLLRHDAVVEFVMEGDGINQLRVSPLLFFAVLVNRAAGDLASSDVVDDWVGSGCRLPVFDVEPLQEFTDAPGRLTFTTALLASFMMPRCSTVPADPYDLVDMAGWLDALDPENRPALLRQLGDAALFRAGVFPDNAGSSELQPYEVEQLGRSAGMSDDEIVELTDPASPTRGIDTLEGLGAAWYRAAADESPSTPTVLRDVAHRIRSARRFLNYLSDRYLYRLQPTWNPLG